MKRHLIAVFTTMCTIFVVLMGLVVHPITAFARDPLDEIQNYTIQVDMRPDGTMDIRYHLEWKVLDSTTEGPLEWVKIGCPNMHVDEITALSDNIKEIKYLADGGSYIRIDFDRQYEKNEIIEFDYSIHQSYMYVLEEDTHLCRYSFTPGWFDDIEVKTIQIMWSNKNVIESTATRTKNDYLIWEGKLAPGDRLNASVKYNLDAFTTNPDEQYTEESGESSGGKVVAIALLILLGVILLVVILVVIFDDDDYHGGFGGRSSHVFVHTHSSCVSRSSCACVSSCACACACAGGGRAGCSKKDFYQYQVKTADLMKVLDEDLSDDKNLDDRKNNE